MLTTLLLFAQLSMPAPKAVLKKPFSKPLVTLHAISLLYDGYTTRRGVQQGFQEGNPVTRAFIGQYPIYGRMAAWGDS